MAMSMMLRRLGVPVTVHGFRSSFRDWAAEQGVKFELAEASLAHAIGSNVTRSYLRTSMLELRRPVLAAWAAYVTGSGADKRDRAQAGRGVIRIAISVEAFEAIAQTLPLGTVGYENERNASGGYFIWLDQRTWSPS
jgi:hypothetical protein